MNKKGFTLVEVLVTIFLVSLTLMMGGYIFSNIIEKSEDKSLAVSIENVKKSANAYVKENSNNLIWINNQSCVPVDILVSKGYLKKDILKTEVSKYILVTHDDNGNIISEEESNSSTCKAVMAKKIPIPTNYDICKNDAYNGSNQNLLINDLNTKFNYLELAPDSITTGKNAGSYKIKVKLKDDFTSKGYFWKDGTTESKEVECYINKATPVLSLNPAIQSSATLGKTQATLTSNVNGTIEIKISNPAYANATSSLSFTEKSPNEFIDVITIENYAKRQTNTYITFTVTPNDKANYESNSAVYTIGEIKPKTIAKPTSSFCKETYYNEKEQVLTGEPSEFGYTFKNNKKTAVGKYIITAEIMPDYLSYFTWSDGTKEPITFDCEIKDRIYYINYHGNSPTSQTYESYCSNENCGLNTAKTIFYDKEKKKYGEEYTLVTNLFKKTGYTFTGWNTKSDGSGTNYSDKAQVKNLTDTNGGTVNLYAQWKINKVIIKYNLNGGSFNGTSTLNYAANSNGYLTLNGTEYQRKVDYGETVDLFNWDGTNIGAKKTGHKGKVGAEYKVNNSTTTVSDGEVAVNNLCNASVSDCTVTLYINWVKTQVKVRYNLNGGSFNGDSANGFGKNSDGYLTKNGSVHEHIVNYGGTINLYNWDGTNIKAKKTGYKGKPDAEYKIGSSTATKTISDTGSNYIDASNLCDASAKDCTVKLFINWADITDPTCSIDFRTGESSWVKDGVDITVKCDDSGSGCVDSSTKYNNVTSDKTYTVKDNAGNSATCKLDIISRKRYSKQTRTYDSCKTSTTYYTGKCKIENVSSSVATSDPSTTVTGSTAAKCKKKCTDKGSAYFIIGGSCDKVVDCEGGYSAWSDWSGYTKKSCTESNTVNCKGPQTQYKKNS